MLMNKIETLTINNPVRSLVQHFVEARLLRKKGGYLNGGTALEIGCGRGEGARIILDRFGAERVVGIDLDPAQVERAQRRLPKKYQKRVEFQTGDAAKLRFTDQTFDAVFDFGILHHVPEWRPALREVHRVLKPGGRFYFDEVLRGFLETRAARSLFVHPQEGHFSAAEFEHACRAAGFEMSGRVTTIGTWFAIGVAIRPSDGI